MNKKKIRVTITLKGDTFDESGTNTLIIENMRILATVRYGGGNIMPVAEIMIYGLNMDVMHKLMRIKWVDLTTMMNIIKLEAGEHNEPYQHLFEGNITFAYIDTSSAPEIGLRIESITSIMESYKIAEPVSYQGEKSVVEAIREITEGMGYGFRNDGVSEELKMKDVTLVETDLNKIRKLCTSYQIDVYIEYGLITITPQGKARDLYIPTISPKTGLLGYPIPTIQGVEFRCLWDTNVRFGGLVRIEDSLMRTTNGDWRVFGLICQLDSEMPDGSWFMEVQGSFRDRNDAAISNL